MPPRCEPESPMFAAGSEKVVWDALKAQLPTGSALIANLHITDGNGDYEADLIVLWPGVGIAVIEVKGGHVTREANGEWRQGSRGSSGVIHPVERARKTKYAIRDYIHKNSSLNKLELSHLVAFPYTPFTAEFEAVDCPRWMILDQADIAGQLANRLRAALDVQGARKNLVEIDDVDRIVDLLTGRPAGQTRLLVPVSELENDVELLTQKQALILDLLRGNRQVEVRGGAGTGKTFLAVEQARRLAGQGERVAFVCYSHGLATFLQRRFAALPAKEQPAYVGTFHNLGIKWAHDLWREHLPTIGRTYFRLRCCALQRTSRTANDSTPWSLTRRRTSRTNGGQPCWRVSSQMTQLGCLCSPMRVNASSNGKGGHP